MNSLIKSIDSKFNDLKVAIKEGRSKWISSSGANALIVIYPPSEEKEYIRRIYKDYKDEYIIDISKLFIKLIDQYSGIEKFKELLKDYKSTPGVLFQNDDPTKKDLFDLILDEIKKGFEQDKIPILIRTGILYGTHIENTQILETKEINKYKKPLVVIYPAEIKEGLNGDEIIYFLGVKKASDYRGQII